MWGELIDRPHRAMYWPGGGGHTEDEKFFERTDPSRGCSR
ncbi:hypothetical protein SynRS9907_01347 [Synechococcus sp. RS9907]|nr:hypothetical protein SynRS9907_01347 [Synechococcus sp. RS9907]